MPFPILCTLVNKATFCVYTGSEGALSDNGCLGSSNSATQQEIDAIKLALGC
jgi:hypothetical protein